MNKRFAIALLLLLITYSFFLLQGCKDDEIIPPASLTQNYVSNDIGRWIIYDVDSIIHLDNDSNTDNNVTRSHFQIMEVIDSMGVDAENDPIQHLSRFRRLNDTVPWDFISRWTAKITKSSYQKVEDNIRYIKLGFPVSAGLKWNGNAFNSLGEEDYFYDNVNQPDSYNGFNFDSTLTVIQGDSTIGYHNYPYGKEKYATGLGMYFHYSAVVDFYPGTSLIISGVEYYERINSFGH